MENKRKLNLFVVLFNGLLSLACIILLSTFLFVGNTTKTQSIEIITDLAASMIALVYLIEGYSKGVARHYKICMIVTAINALAVTILSTAEKIQYIPFIMCLIAFIILLALSFINNLGKKTSYILCTILVLIRAAGLISIIITFGHSIELALLVTQLSLALMISVLTYAKYTDKTSRNAY